jgi:hypothetical protein
MNTGKDQLIKLSPNQLSPRDTRPEDFEIESDELEFGGACGDNLREYNELLQVGPAARKAPRP